MILLCLLFVQDAQAWQSQFKKSLKNGGALVVDAQGKTIFSHRADEHFIPASTIKIAMAACAIHTLGEDYHFQTDFVQSKSGDLLVKGYGDPFLVSEEFPKIISGLKKSGLKKVRHLVLDTSHFSSDIRVDGAGGSTNPYDALNGALIANFNTVFITKDAGGNVISAEKQTPITDLAKKAASRLRKKKERINLGNDPEVGARYFGELLKAFLVQSGVQVSGEIHVTSKAVPFKKVLYTHRSSKSLQENIKGLLKYSTNFISNQLYLASGAKVYGAPATLEKGQKVLQEFLQDQVGWENFSVVEGAGLSRKNKVTAKLMMELLDYFEPYQGLLPIREKVIQAKTGTLTGVNTYAGYLVNPGNHYKFVLLVNDSVPHGYKYQLAKQLYKNIKGQ